MAWLATRDGVRLEQFWYLCVATVTLPAVISLWLPRREFGRRLLHAWPESADSLGPSLPASP